MRLPAILVVLLATMAPALPVAQELDSSVPPALRKAIETAHRQKYTGTRVVEFRHGPDNHRHTEFVMRDGDRTRIEFPKDSAFAGQIIVETREERKHYLPDHNVIRIMPPRREEALLRFVRLGRHREQRVIGSGPGETIAGRRTDQIVVMDKSGNVTQRLFIEPRTGILLKRQLFDKGGAPVGYFEFTEINLVPKIDSRVFVLEHRGATIVRPEDELATNAKKEGFPYVVLPSAGGVRLMFSRPIQLAGVRALEESYVTPEGRLSLFLVRGAVAPDRLRQIAHSDSHSDLNVKTWNRDGITYVLVGGHDVTAVGRLAERIGQGN